MTRGGAGPVQLERRVRREDRADALRWIALARSLAATLDLLPQPMVLAVPGRPLEVWHANASARDRLPASALLPMREGRLWTNGEDNAAELQQAIERAFASPARQRQRAMLIGPEGHPLPVHVQALDFGVSPDLPVSQLVLLDIQERFPPERGLQRLCERFELTRKEAECAVGLYAIGSVEKFARCSGKSVHTVRTQLKAAMQKTCTHTQAALVALVVSQLND